MSGFDRLSEVTFLIGGMLTLAGGALLIIPLAQKFRRKKINEYLKKRRKG